MTYVKRLKCREADCGLTHPSRPQHICAHCFGRFEVVTNIRQASVSREIGLVRLELSGEESEVERAVGFLSENGVSVEPVELGVVE